jgi:hypothetical protein
MSLTLTLSLYHPIHTKSVNYEVTKNLQIHSKASKLQVDSS